MPLSIVASAHFNFMSTLLRFVPKPFLKIKKRPVFRTESWRSLPLTPPQPTQPLPPLLKPDPTHFPTPLLNPILTNNSLHGLHQIVHSSPNRWNLLNFLRVENQLSYQKVITLVWQDLSLENLCHILSHFSLDNMSLISLWLKKTVEGLVPTAWNFPWMLFHPFQMLGITIINPQNYGTTPGFAKNICLWPSDFGRQLFLIAGIEVIWSPQFECIKLQNLISFWLLFFYFHNLVDFIYFSFSPKDFFPQTEVKYSLKFLGDGLCWHWCTPLTGASSRPGLTDPNITFVLLEDRRKMSYVHGQEQRQDADSQPAREKKG